MNDRSARLHRILGGPDTAWLVERIRHRISYDKPLVGTLSLKNPTAAQRKAIELILGRPPGRGDSLSVSLGDLDTAVRRSGLHPEGIAAAITDLTGPIVNLIHQRDTIATAWHQALAPLTQLATSDRPGLATWATDPATTGLIRRLTGNPTTAAPLVSTLITILEALPTNSTPLPRFAADITGNAHALDRGQALATITLSAIRAGWGSAITDEGTPAQRRRALWDTVGVLVDELSSTVLVLNVAFSPDSRPHNLTSAATAAGEPIVLTLRHIARAPLTWVTPSVFICENPAVVAAAADQLGRHCPPLICVNGQPTTAALRLIDAARDAHANIAYHGDFDWGGFRIANLLYTRVRWKPWRFDTAAYAEAITAHHRGGPLAGSPVEALWDPHLAKAVMTAGHRVEEELVLDDILEDLDAAAKTGSSA